MPRAEPLTHPKPSATEWPRAVVALPEGRWIAARVRVIDATVVVMDRDGEVVATYELDGPMVPDTYAASPELVGSYRGDDTLIVSVFNGCTCETTRWIPWGEF